jgi:hypothetical protein
MLNVGQTMVVGPWVAADRDRMRALIVGAIDQDAALGIVRSRPRKLLAFLLAFFKIAQR